MGSTSRTKAARLGEKLLRIRLALGLSQNGMLERLGFIEELFRSNVSQYELGTRVPPLPVLLEYARAAGVYVDDLIDDEIGLPDKIPGTVRHEGIKRKTGARGKKH
ncbi:MAG TPA: helix-turn-helix transcriptional regulator [Pyrinomonadaceae bacterium]|jgi:transcriptional regulator with XRE-family HTH domain|nr:helix-turn-helix transcriptional regulator [Pyrinomonadaceae bacterium]